MAVVGVLEIQMAADLARLSKGMTDAQKMVNNTVGTINKALGAIGVGLSIAGIGSIVKGVVDAADKMNDLRKITGLTVKELAGLEKVAALNGSSLDTITKAVGIMSKNIVAGSSALQQLGIQTKQSNGDFRTSSAVLLDVAGRFETMRDGVQKAALAQEIFGKSGRELIPMLNEGRAALASQIEQYGKASGFTTKLAEDSDRFNDILVMLSGNVTATKNNFVAGLLPALNDIGSAFTKVSGSAQLFQAIGSGIGIAMKGVVIAVATAAGALKSLGLAIDGIARQIIALTNLDFKGAIAEGDRYFSAIAQTAKGNAEFIKSILDGDRAVDQSAKGISKLTDFHAQLATGTDKATKSAEKQNKEFNMQLYLLKQYDDEAKRARDITDDVATEQERYNKKLQELNRLKPYLTVETYDRALKKLDDTNKKVTVSTEITTDAVTQFWIQANRNIQSSLANGIFDFFTDGLDGMVRSVKTAVLRIISEFAALKVLEFFGGTSGTAGTGGTVSTLAGLASMFSGARGGGGGFATGGGVTTGAFSNAGGAGTAFVGGQGTALGGSGMGVTATRANSVLSGGNIMALGAMAGPYGMAAAAAFMAMQALEKKVGDYKLTGGAKFALGAYEMFSPMAYTVKGLGLQTPEALIGKFLFGRGPYKFRQQSIQGGISNQGLDGTITDVFKSKGGVFKKNKHKEFETALPSEIYRDIDKTLSNIYKSTNKFAKNLGMDASQIDKYTKEIQVVSEKGKTITTEAVTEMLTGVADDIARLAMPNVEAFALTGESASKTFERLNNEMDALKSAAENLGASVGYAAELINGMSIDARSAFIDQAGGMEKLADDTSAFFQNFLSDADRLAIRTSQLNDRLENIGVDINITQEQYRSLIQSTNTNNDVRIGLLDRATQELFLAVRQSQQILSGIGLTDQGNNAFAALQKSIDAEKLRITNKYNDAVEESDRKISSISETIARLGDIAGKLRQAVNSINPMSMLQARSQIENGSFDSSNINQAIAKLSENNASGFGNVLEFKRSQASNVRLLNGLEKDVDIRMVMAQKELAVQEAARRSLDNGFSRQISRLDDIIVNARTQVDALNGISTNTLSINTALGELNRILIQSLQSPVGGGGGVPAPVSGNPNISSADIVRFIDLNKKNPLEIYKAAIKNGVSSGQIAATGAYTQKQIDDFVKENKLASFDVGGVVPRTGIAMIHKNEQILTATDSVNMSKQIEQLTTAVEVLTIANNKMNRRFDKWDNEGLPAERVA